MEEERRGSQRFDWALPAELRALISKACCVFETAPSVGTHLISPQLFHASTELLRVTAHGTTLLCLLIRVTHRQSMFYAPSKPTIFIFLLSFQLFPRTSFFCCWALLRCLHHVQNLRRLQARLSRHHGWLERERGGEGGRLERHAFQNNAVEVRVEGGWGGGSQKNSVGRDIHRHALIAIDPASHALKAAHRSPPPPPRRHPHSGRYPLASKSTKSAPFPASPCPLPGPVSC